MEDDDYDDEDEEYKVRGPWCTVGYYVKDPNEIKLDLDDLDDALSTEQAKVTSASAVQDLLQECSAKSLPYQDIADVLALDPEWFNQLEDSGDEIEEYYEEEEEDDGLGYYPDGVKRTLTDAQIEIFRHSELFRIERRRELRRERGEASDDSSLESDASQPVREEVPYNQRHKRKWEGYIKTVDPVQGSLTQRRIARELDEQRTSTVHIDYGDDSSTTVLQSRATAGPTNYDDAQSTNEPASKARKGPSGRRVASGEDDAATTSQSIPDQRSGKRGASRNGHNTLRSNPRVHQPPPGRRIISYDDDD